MDLRDKGILFRIVLLLGASALLSCGHLSTPNYHTAEFQGGLPKASPVRGTTAYTSFSGPMQLEPPVGNFKINRGYFKNKGKRPHKGIDLGGRRGDAIYAAHHGTVVYAGRGFRGYGKMVLIEYDNTWATLYAHLNKYRVKTGDVVRAGDLIGDMGSTGRTTGVHLHFELIKNKQPIDPLPYLRVDRYISGN